MGLWVLQQCRATWADEGHDYTYDVLVQLAKEATSLKYLVDVDDSRFLAVGNHPKHIQDWCAEHDLPVPQTHGEIVRCVLESLALKYRAVVDKLIAISGQSIDVIHIVGGGTQNDLLNQFTADATGKTVITGPIEATVLGNAAVQFIANAELESIGQARQIIADMGITKTYQPEHTQAWHDAYQKLLAN
jgi:rhamnulokinase